MLAYAFSLVVALILVICAIVACIYGIVFAVAALGLVVEVFFELMAWLKECWDRATYLAGFAVGRCIRFVRNRLK